MSNEDLFLEKCCRFCGLEKLPLNSVLQFDEDEQSIEPNLLQKIRYCLPVEINPYDAYPKRICDECCANTRMVYDFIEMILTTQKLLASKLDTVELIKTNKSKCLQTFGQNSSAISEQISKNDEKPTVSGYKATAPETSTATTNKNTEIKNVLAKLNLKSMLTIKPVSANTAPTMMVIECKPENLFPSINMSAIKLEEPISDPQMIARGAVSIFENYECIEEKYADSTDDANAAEEDDDEDKPYVANEDDDDDDDDDEEDEDDDDEDEKIPIAKLRKRKRRPANSQQKSDKIVIVKMDLPACYVCLLCKDKFESFEELRKHMKTNSSCKQINLTCEVCSKICDNRKSLYQHSLTHRDKNQCVCDECGKTYSNRFNLENHKSSFHGQTVEEFGNIYKCKTCEQQFTSRKDLYIHINTHTKQPTINLCDTCGKCFSSAETLRSHIRTHKDIRPFPCSHCEKRFRSRLQLKQHSHVHTGIKPFVCFVCGKTFAKQGSLTAHSRSHTGDTPYECPDCLEKFPSIGKMKTHLKSHNLPFTTNQPPALGAAPADGLLITQPALNLPLFVPSIHLQL